MKSVNDDLDRIYRLNMNMQKLFREWHELDERSGRSGGIGVWPMLQATNALAADYDDDALRAELRNQADGAEAMAVAVFHKAAGGAPGTPGPRATGEPLRGGPAPERWEAEGLYDEPGLTLEQARERTAFPLPGGGPPGAAPRRRLPAAALPPEWRTPRRRPTPRVGGISEPLRPDHLQARGPRLRRLRRRRLAGPGRAQIVDNSEQVLDPMTAYQMVSMLQGVVERGTGTAAKAIGKPVAGKTGTTNDYHDAWFVGFSPDMVAGVYVGFDKPRSLGKGATGGLLAAPIFTEFMKMALADKPAIPFRVPPGMNFIPIDRKTGLRANPGDPGTILEAFKPGTGPPDTYSIIGYTDTMGRPRRSPPDSDRAVISGTGGLY